MSIESKLEMAESPRVPPAKSLQGTAPTLTNRGLTLLLVMMCIGPMLIIAWLWSILPEINEEQLEAKVTAVNFMPDSYFEIPIEERPYPEPGPRVLVQNLGDQEWTLINLIVNGAFQTYETKVPLEPGKSMEFELDLCLSMNGARFNPKLLKVPRVRVFARLPSKVRATHTHYFVEKDGPKKKADDAAKAEPDQAKSLNP